MLRQFLGGTQQHCLRPGLLRVDPLQSPDQKRRSLSGARLGLRDGVLSEDQRLDAQRLDLGRQLVTVAVDSTQQVVR